MPSSVIRSIEYDPERYRLFVTFVSGRIYVYDGVPQHAHEEFEAASSKGAFFNRYIRDRYRFREILVVG
jgi:hypothetical protein